MSKRGRKPQDGRVSHPPLGNAWNAKLKRVPQRDGNFVTREESEAARNEHRQEKVSNGKGRNRHRRIAAPDR